ncbi:leucine-rich repeat-containing protein 17 isoform X1 [Esox lucius]|uniref:LRRCT domain-containing protein n=2 Tax=Esox lucius TaxID=8010 RepID=A0A3P8Y228_ESOLU|nr:leucine-rich repeat-containing protein 17 isoform X1 [Esox lucius]
MDLRFVLSFKASRFLPLTVTSFPDASSYPRPSHQLSSKGHYSPRSLLLPLVLLAPGPPPSSSMRLLSALLLLLLFRSVEPRKGDRGWDQNRSGRARGKGRANAVRRQTSDCKEYIDASEKFLDCQDRQLTGVQQHWPEDIEHLQLGRNKIQVLRDNTFSRFKNLISLDLQQNEISQLEEEAFAGLTQLTTLLLQHNNIKTASEEHLLPLPRLQHLRLYDNPWDCSCKLESLVRTLQVPSNRNLGNYAKCSWPEALRGEKLKKVRVERVCPGGHLPGQKPPEGPGRLPKPPPNVNSVCHTYMFPKPMLDCKSKELKNIPSDLPSDIVKMDLSRNSITHLRPNEFVAARDLKLLNLSSNSLDQIATAAFAGLLYLQELDLSNNSLHYFPYGVLEDLYFLRKMNLGDNPWVCDYNIHYLIYWLKHHPGVAYTGLVCAEPPEFRGWQVENYVKTYNGECPKDKERQPGTADSGTDQNETGAGMDTAEELVTQVDEEELLPRPLRDPRPKKYDVIRLS